MTNMQRAMTAAAFLLVGSVTTAMAAAGDARSGGPDNAANAPTPHSATTTADKIGPAVGTTVAPPTAATMPIHPTPGDGKSGGPANAANVATPGAASTTADKIGPMIVTPGTTASGAGQTTAKPVPGNGSSGGVSKGNDG